MGIIFFGNEKLATGVTTKSTVRKALIDKGYSLQEIDKGAKDLKEQLRSMEPKVGVLVAYGAILPADIINFFTRGIINIHPSMLPKGRGPAPIEETILNGDKQTGVSIMQLTTEMDKGPILSQQKIALRGNETKQELSDTLLKLGSDLLISCLPDIFAGNIDAVPQVDTEATYTCKIKKSDGIIDWNKPALHLEREIRAYAGWPKSRTKLGGLDCIITDADIVKGSGKPGEFEVNGNSLIIFAGEGALLIKRIQPADKKEMAVEEFLRGYASRL